MPVDVIAECDGDGAFSDIPDVAPDDPNYNMFENIDFQLADPDKFPRVSQPLIAAAWEQENYDVIEMLMTYKPDVSSLYANQTTQEPKPLFFHVSINLELLALKIADLHFTLSVYQWSLVG